MPYHSYIFFDVEPNIHILSEPELKKAKKDFIHCIEENTDVRSLAYATLALKSGTRFMLHMNAKTPDAIQLLVRDLLRTPLGAHVRITYTLLGLTRASQYNPKQPPKEAGWDLKHRYLVIYPFTKTTEWHLMPYEERRTVMKAHVDVGRKHSEKISQRLLYSYGIDDHEFIVSYQMDDLDAFQTLVMDMRETESRRHTKNDLPIFTCIHMPLQEALNML
ncbi:MAG TPA: chlorite dismutase family protein [Candidatus Paceibacterota bacterium]|nr:chlorite dismutase family protein [Candidatus Paceibacterota bacterium]